MTSERRLGRGLEALLGRMPHQVDAPVPAEGQPPAEDPYGGATEGPYGSATPPEETTRENSVGEAAGQSIPQPSGDQNDPPASAQPAIAVGQSPARIDIHQIDRGEFQPRRHFDQAETQSLAESITAHGLLQPVIVRKVADRYELIAGERRLRAAKQAGWADLPANVIEADDRETAELAIVENLQRKDLNPLEKAASFQRYLQQYACTQEDLAARLNLDRSTIANLIRLLELPEAVQDAICRAKITQGHARALLPLGEEQEQIDFCGRIQREGLSVRQTEALVQEAIDAADAEPLGVIDRGGRASRAARVPSAHIAGLEQELRAALGTKVKITHGAGGRGKIAIHFGSHEEFERLRRRITDAERPDAHNQAG